MKCTPIIHCVSLSGGKDSSATACLALETQPRESLRFAACDTRPDTFLSVAEVAALTGRKKHSLQIALLKKIGMPFWVNARGQPIIARTALDGRKEVVKPPAANEPWVPNVLRKKAG